MFDEPRVIFIARPVPRGDHSLRTAIKPGPWLCCKPYEAFLSLQTFLISGEKPGGISIYTSFKSP